MIAECTTDDFKFQPLGRREVIGRFDGGTITSDAGGLLLRELGGWLGSERSEAPRRVDSDC